MRQTRRGCYAAQGGGAKSYIWKVYAINSDEVRTTEHYPVPNGATVQFASSYSVSGGVFVLGSLSSATIYTDTTGDLVGKYIPDTDTKIHKINSYISYSHQAHMYNAEVFTLTNSRGEDTGMTVESEDENDYPADGIQGDYYYVMVRGYGTVYIWDVYNLTTTYGYKERTSSGYSVSMATNNNLYVASTYTFDTTTGYYTLTNPSATTSSGSVSGKYWMKISSGKSQNMYYGWTDWAWIPGSTGTITTTRYYASKDTSNVIYTKGSATGEQVQSVSQNAYPSDGVQGDYWYTYNSSYTGWFDFT